MQEIVIEVQEIIKEVQASWSDMQGIIIEVQAFW
jgi:hypothetical protein